MTLDEAFRYIVLPVVGSVAFVAIAILAYELTRDLLREARERR